MAQSADDQSICPEPLPLGAVTPGMLRGAVVRRNLLEEALSHPGYRVLHEAMEREAFDQRREALMAKTDREYRCAMAKAKMVDAAHRLLARYVTLGDAKIQRPMPRVRLHRQTFGSDAEAGEAMRRAADVRGLLKLGGWNFLAATLACLAWAHCDMLEMGTGDDLAHRAAIQGIVAWFDIAQDALDLGVDAEAWIRAQAEEHDSQQRKE